MNQQRRQTKQIVRERFLARLPKGGLAVEIGVWKGEFSRSILEAIEPERLVLIDPWEHIGEDSHAEALAARANAGKMDRIFEKVRTMYSAEIASGQVVIERGYSVPVLKTFDDESISFAYVDGDHSYEGVRADLEVLFSKMKIGGVIGFDDYHRKGWWGDGVLAAIHEFIGRNPRDIRIHAVEGAQIAIQRVSPLELDADG